MGQAHQFGMGAFSLDTITVFAIFTHSAELTYSQQQRGGVRDHAWQGVRVPEREGRVADRAVSGLLTGVPGEHCAQPSGRPHEWGPCYRSGDRQGSCCRFLVRGVGGSCAGGEEEIRGKKRASEAGGNCLWVRALLLPLLILACLLRSLSLASPQRWITVDVGPMACISIIS